MRLHDALEFFARIRPDAPFARFEGREMDYGQAHLESNRIAQALARSGLAPGDRIAVLSKNSLEYVLLYYGCAKAGVVPVPLNYRLAPPEWQFIVEDSEARLVYARGELADALEPVRGPLESVERFLVSGADVRDGWESYEDWIGGASDAPLDRSLDDSADVYQMYTSGTTGRPKGAVLTHRAVTANLTQLGGILRLEPGDRYQVVAPLYHAAAAVTSFFVVSTGGCLQILEDFHPGEVVRALDEDGIVGTTLVPAMIQACLVMVPDIEERRFGDLRFVLYGASPIAEETLRRAMQVFGCGFAQGYGMTETTAAMTFLLPEDHERALRDKPELLLSCGRPLLGTEIRIVDAHDEPVPNGEIGQIVARGPQLMRGYWNLEDATAEALAGGWMHTGDAGTRDDEGFIYIQDRVKDMIVSGGENVYPREIEDVLFQHEAVADAAVIGVPSEQWGEEVKAIVVLREGASASANDLLEHCKGRLGGYKRPRSVEFLDALPRNPSGKVLKKDLREPYWQGHDRRVS